MMNKDDNNLIVKEPDVKTYTFEEALIESTSYFQGDVLAATV